MPDFACRDLGMDCNQVVHGATMEEVKQKAFDHAREIHAEMFQSMNTPEQLAQVERIIEAKIR
ncbi:MAG: DUF1059 domain-containing protein [Chloroflexi bacterium]|nr:DUF1059 domain-containing protein [Chloroflexota bacterium]